MGTVVVLIGKKSNVAMVWQLQDFLMLKER
jgi:hypothetical protein